MNSKIKLIKVERILVQVVPRFYEMMLGEPPNHRTVQRDDLRIAQLRGDWSRRSSTIIPSPVHSKLIKHPMPMVPMWKFPTSTMVSFRVFFLNGGRDYQKKYMPFHSGWGTLFQEDLDAKNPPRFCRYLGPCLGVDIRGTPLIIINLITIKSCLVQSPIILFNYSNIYLWYLHVFYQYLWFHSFFTSSITRVLHSSRLTPQVLSSSQGNILEDEAAVQVSRIVEWSLRKVPRFFSQFDHGIYWKYHGNIVGYDGIYIYNLCMRYHGWLPNSTPVEGCGKKPMGFNHPKVVQDFARIHSSFLKTVA